MRTIPAIALALMLNASPIWAASCASDANYGKETSAVSETALNDVINNLRSNNCDYGGTCSYSTSGNDGGSVQAQMQLDDTSPSLCAEALNDIYNQCLGGYPVYSIGAWYADGQWYWLYGVVEN
jgi:hypothetical protein